MKKYLPLKSNTFLPSPFLASSVLSGPWMPPPPPSRNFNMFAFHGKWNYPQMAKVFDPAKSVYVTILRDPVENFESMFTYNVLGRSKVERNLTRCSHATSHILRRFRTRPTSTTLPRGSSART